MARQILILLASVLTIVRTVHFTMPLANHSLLLEAIIVHIVQPCISWVFCCFWARLQRMSLKSTLGECHSYRCHRPAKTLHQSLVTNSLPTVHLDDATFTDTRSGLVSKFLGIPFAHPPCVQYYIPSDNPQTCRIDIDSTGWPISDFVCLCGSDHISQAMGSMQRLLEPLATQQPIIKLP